METYYLTGQYPDGEQFRAEVTVNNVRDAMILAQGAQRVTTLKYCDVVDYKDGSVRGHFVPLIRTT